MFSKFNNIQINHALFEIWLLV